MTVFRIVPPSLVNVCGDGLEERLRRRVGVEQHDGLGVVLQVRVQGHGDAQLGVRRAVAEEVGVGLVVAGGVAALELVDDVIGIQDRLDAVDLLGLRADHAADVLGQHLVGGRDPVGDVTAGVAGHQLKLAAEDAAGRVDLALGHLGTLKHCLAEARQPAGEAGKDAVGDRAAGRAAASAGAGGRAGGQHDRGCAGRDRSADRWKFHAGSPLFSASRPAVPVCCARSARPSGSPSQLMRPT